MIYFEVRQQKSGNLVASNMQACPHLALLAQNKNVTLRSQGIKSVSTAVDDLSIWLVVDGAEQDLLNSNRLFNKTLKIYANLSSELLDYYLGKIKVHSHTLRSIQGKMKQKIDGLASKDDFRAENYAESKQKIGSKISTDIDKSADTLCFLNKRIAEIDAHINGFDVLYMDDDHEINLQDVNLKKVLLNILAPFLGELSKMNINVEVAIKDDYADAQHITLDYKMFNLAMTNFFDNMVKYAKPNESIRIEFAKESDKFSITVSMMSRRIDDDELSKIFEEGFSGRHAQSDAGDGIGMSVVQKALKLTNMKIDIQSNNSAGYVSEGHAYARNIFKIGSI